MEPARTHPGVYVPPVLGCRAFRRLRGYARGEAGTDVPLDFCLIHVPPSLIVGRPTPHASIEYQLVH